MVAIPNLKPLPLRVKKGIKERYTSEIDEILSHAQKLTGQPSLEFVPNFEANYNALVAFEETLDRSDGEDDGKLSEYWMDTLGQATREYYEGFVDRLRGDGFKEDDVLKEAFRDAISRVEVRIVKDSTVDGACDCIIDNKSLVIRTTVERWFQSTSRCAEGLVNLL